jgi:hypothetical protein
MDGPRHAAPTGAMEMAPQAPEKIVFGDGNGAIRGRRTSNEGTTGIEATMRQVLAPNALKSRGRCQNCTAIHGALRRAELRSEAAVGSQGEIAP